MKNIWRDYWKGQTYNASALIWMLFCKTWGCCSAKHGDIAIISSSCELSLLGNNTYTGGSTLRLKALRVKAA